MGGRGKIFSRYGCKQDDTDCKGYEDDQKAERQDCQVDVGAFHRDRYCG